MITLQTLEDNTYSVILRVLAFDEMDAQVSFQIKVENDVGYRDFSLQLSTDEPPNGKFYCVFPRPTICVASLLVVLR